MVNRDVVATKLVALATRVERVRKHAKARSAELAADQDALDLVAFNLMLAVQICSDLASHIIADEGWPAARTIAEGFSRLHEHGVLSAANAQALGRAAGLRNVVAHGYAEVDVALVHAAATAGAGDLDTFAREVATWVASRP